MQPGRPADRRSTDPDARSIFEHTRLREHERHPRLGLRMPLPLDTYRRATAPAITLARLSEWRALASLRAAKQLRNLRGRTLAQWIVTPLEAGVSESSERARRTREWDT